MATAITTATQLQNMKNDLTDSYELGCDIDASATVGWNGGLGFEPLGDNITPFTGNFDGKSFAIIDLFINRPALWRCGLFGKTGAATGIIKNVTLTNCNVSGNGIVGALIGSCYSEVENCDSSGSISAVWDGVGGLIGYHDDNGICRGCNSSCIVSGRDNTGGCIGQNFGVVAGSYATGPVAGTRYYTGGFVGSHEGGSISCCDATGIVIGADYVGGFVGYCEESISDGYATGAVDGDDYVGGFAGASQVLNRCYSVGSITHGVGATRVGGFTGFNYDTMNACFWDETTSGEATGAGGGSPQTGVKGKTTAQMKALATILEAGWSIPGIWNITPGCNSGYPCLVGVNACCGDSAIAGVDPTIASQNVSLELIRNLEMMNTGRFYINKAGNAVYESRYHR